MMIRLDFSVQLILGIPRKGVFVAGLSSSLHSEVSTRDAYVDAVDIHARGYSPL